MHHVAGTVSVFRSEFNMEQRHPGTPAGKSPGRAPMLRSEALAHGDGNPKCSAATIIHNVNKRRERRSTEGKRETIVECSVKA